MENHSSLSFNNFLNLPKMQHLPNPFKNINNVFNRRIKNQIIQLTILLMKELNSLLKIKLSQKFKKELNNMYNKKIVQQSKSLIRLDGLILNIHSESLEWINFNNF